MYHHKWLYHETHAPAGKMFRSDTEEAAAGDGWVDTPAKFGQTEPAVDAAPEPMEMASGIESEPEQSIQPAPPAPSPYPVIHRKPRK